MALALVAGTALSMGCQTKTDQTRADDNRLEKRTDAKEAREDYIYSQKSEFNENMKKELNKIDDEVERLDDQADNATGIAKDEAKAQIEVMREKIRMVKIKLSEVESATESTWAQTRDDFRKAFNQLQSDLTQTRQFVNSRLQS